jgi:hypothetical protein
LSRSSTKPLRPPPWSRLFCRRRWCRIRRRPPAISPTFDGNRYVDRFVVRGGKIVQMDVWNDSAERLLVRAGIDA